MTPPRAAILGPSTVAVAQLVEPLVVVQVVVGSSPISHLNRRKSRLRRTTFVGWVSDERMERRRAEPASAAIVADWIS